MSVNSSSSSNDSLLLPDLFSNNLMPSYMKCYTSSPSFFIYITYRITYISLLFPLCIFILYHGVQQWRQKNATSSAEPMSHSDSFTYHMAIMELIGVLGSVVVMCGVCSHHVKTFQVGFFVLSFKFYGEVFFHVLTCVVHYLAVVHPITYLSLRKERGIRMRNIAIGCVWLLGLVGSCCVMNDDFFIIVDFTIMIPSLTVVSFCSLSVLCVLIRPGPGDQGGDRERVDQSKQRAFTTILILLGVLMLRFVSNLVWSFLFSLARGECVVITSGLWFFLPSSLVLPLLFLHRAGKLVCWKNNIQ